MSDRYRYHRYYGGTGTSAAYDPLTTSTGRYQKSSTTANVSALDRLRSNLSPVSTYYKPLMRSFGVSIFQEIYMDFSWLFSI